MHTTTLAFIVCYWYHICMSTLCIKRVRVGKRAGEYRTTHNGITYHAKTQQELYKLVFNN